jgi:hypothetical protein
MTQVNTYLVMTTLVLSSVFYRPAIDLTIFHRLTIT